MKQALISQDLDFQKSRCRLNGRQLDDDDYLKVDVSVVHVYERKTVRKRKKLKVLCLSKVRQRQISEICMTMCLLNDLAITYLLVTRDKFARLDL